MSIPKNLRTLKTNFEEADGLGFKNLSILKENFGSADGLGNNLKKISHFFLTFTQYRQTQWEVLKNPFDLLRIC